MLPKERTELTDCSVIRVNIIPKMIVLLTFFLYEYHFCRQMNATVDEWA